MFSDTGTKVVLSKQPTKVMLYLSDTGTKVVLSKQLVEHADKLKKQTLTLKFPKKLPRKEKESKRGHGKLKRKASNTPHCDYLTVCKPANLCGIIKIFNEIEFIRKYTIVSILFNHLLLTCYL